MDRRVGLRILSPITQLLGFYHVNFSLTLSPHHILQPHPISKLSPWCLKETSVGPSVGNPAFHQVHPCPPWFLQTPVLLHLSRDRVERMVSPVPM